MNFLKNFVIAIAIIGLTSINSQAQVREKSWRSIIYNPDSAWFATQEAKDIADNVLLYQRNIGGWPKNIQMQKPLSNQEKLQLEKEKSSTEEVTTDNSATTQEMFFLSKMYQATADEKYKIAFLSGLNYVLEAQYDSGGWPQFYPLKEGYYTHITFNDDSMVNILNLLKDLKDDTGKYAIKPSTDIIKRIEMAFDKGIACILKTQYKQNGVLTAWCAQYDETTFQPAKARAYELPSLSGSESANIVLLLMDLKNPSDAVKTAITSAVTWFEKVKLTGIKQVWEYDEQTKKRNKIIVKDENASPLWARFMELDDNRPFFSDRDGIKKYALNEIGDERRNGYGWYSENPRKVLEKYPEWKATYDTPKKKK